MEPLIWKAKHLNSVIEDVANWFICLQGKEYGPGGKAGPIIFWDKDENLKFGAKVEMKGFGKIYKTMILTSDLYRLQEIPKDRWEVVFLEIFNETGDASPPRVIDDDFIQNADQWYENRGLDPRNTLAYRGKWWPPPSYVQELVLKRNFMNVPEFIAYADTIDTMHRNLGGKAPNYVVHQPFVQVARKVQ